jgi:putative endonuclease
VYVLFGKSDNKFYIGFTEDLRARFKKHQEKGNYTTKRFGELELVYYEACKNEADALVREKQLKTGFGRGYLRNRIQKYLASNNN